MEDHVDIGMGKKRLSTYIEGFIACTILTLCAFYSVMSGIFSQLEIFFIIYTAAILQFFVQLYCFLRLNTHTPQARMNVMSLIFTAVILITIVIGSLWIMHNLNYNMIH